MHRLVSRRPPFGLKAALALAALGVLSTVGAPAARAQNKVIKIATLAPDGSSWMKLIREWAANIEKRAPGVKLTFFAGGVAGDERDAVRKMKLGQLQGAALTATGLGLLQPQVRVFESPFMWNNVGEMDRVRAMLDDDIRKLFLEKGYVLLNWGDVGPVHLFTNVEIKSKDDLPKLKMWQWGDDPVVKGLFAAMGLKGVNLGVPDVLPSLQTGLIDACYGSPLSTLALQWNTKIKFMTKMAVSYAIGAQVMTKASWDALGPEVQKVILEESKKLDEKMRATVRDQDNARSLTKMVQLGLKVVDTPEPLVKDFMEKGRKLTVDLDGQLYTKEFRLKVEGLRDQLRGGKK